MKKITYKELRNLESSPVLSVHKRGRARWKVHREHGGDGKSKETFIRKTCQKRHLVRLRHRWEDDIAMNLKERGRRV
jgi:hypothetical protein